MDWDSHPTETAEVTARASDEVSLDIVISLIGGVAIGLLVAALVGGIGWLLKVQTGALAGGVGLVVGASTVVTILTRLTLKAASPPDGELPF